MSADSQAVETAVRRYYAALEAGEPLAPFFDLDGPWQPVVKIGTETREFDVGRGAVAAVLSKVSRELRDNRVDSRRLLTYVTGDAAWFADEVWWAGTSFSTPFAGLTRWSGVLHRRQAQWRFVLMHVSEPVE
ncbi:MAG: hypothetical protein CL878_14530 [Dehalococcoidia bacterium]|nr:hypothetical protein [Dehalococcoidia bacterium]